MATAIAYNMKAPPFVLYSVLTVGYSTNALGGAGGPLAVFFVTVIAVFLGKLVSKRTPVDLIVTPAVTIIGGVAIATFLAPPIGQAAVWLGDMVMLATNMQPFIMGIIVSAAMGIILTLPISSAAICAALGLVGLAGGAATAGCCAHMVGFAVASFRENGRQRPDRPGTRHLHAPGSQPDAQAHPVAACGCCLYRERPHRHLRLQDEDERRPRFLRYGHQRPGGPHRCHHRLVWPL